MKEHNTMIKNLKKKTRQNYLKLFKYDSLKKNSNEGCYGLNIYVLLKFIAWSLNTQCDGPRRWVFGREFSMIGLCHYKKKETRAFSLSLSLPYEDTAIRWLSANHKETDH